MIALGKKWADTDMSGIQADQTEAALAKKCVGGVCGEMSAWDIVRIMIIIILKSVLQAG